MNRKIIVGAAFASVLVVAAVSPALHGTTQRKLYVTGGTGLALAVNDCSSSTTGIGGHCFQGLHSGLTSAQVTITDWSGHRVGGWYLFSTGDDSLGSGLFCRTATLAVPSGARELHVWVGGTNGIACGNDLGQATTGMISVAFA